MNKFTITREWLAQVLSVTDNAMEVTFRGAEARAVLRAAWKGMGYADAPAEVFDFVPRQNPNWLKFFEEQKQREKLAATARAKFQVVSKGK